MVIWLQGIQDENGWVSFLRLKDVAHKKSAISERRKAIAAARGV